MPFLVTVDDVGWWSGQDGSAGNQPFRTGMKRAHVPEDYQALAVLGRALEMKIPAGFVMCEWDKTGLLRRLPSATWMGEQWRAPFQNRAQKEEAAGIIKEAESFLEPALHGVGHEFWINGKMDRSEFHTPSGKMRPPDEVDKHLEYFFRLMEQNGLDTGVRLFIPPALNHSFGNGDRGFQKIAGSFGIQYVTLVFDRARCHAKPQIPGVAWENGVILLERGLSPIPWNQTAPEPEFDFERPILPLHWANLLDEDPAKNPDVVHAWAGFIKEKAGEKGAVPARDIASCLTQYLNATQSRIRKEGEDFVIHMDWIRKVPETALADEIFFSIKKPLGCTDIKIIGAEKKRSSRIAEAGFLKLGLPESGKLVFQFCRGGLI